MLMTLNRILDIPDMEPPKAYAYLSGNSQYPNLKGVVLIYSLGNLSLVLASVKGLSGSGFHGFHIHEGEKCSGNVQDSFADVKGHFNPTMEEHPYHAGDLPPLLSNDGYAFLSFVTDRFNPEEVMGKTVIIHAMPDDFHSQPAGDSGMKIACGKIVKNDWESANGR